MGFAAMDFNSIINLGSLTTLIGMGITFIMLYVLVVVISLISKLNNTSKKIPKNKLKIAKNENSLIDSGLNENNLELIAAIAAVYAMLEDSGEHIPKANFVVRSVRRISSGGQ